MPDPSWTMQYLMNQTPEGNGFTRQFCYSQQAIVTEVTGGNPADRRVEIDATAGPQAGVVFATSQVPSLDSSIGITAEMIVNVSGDPNGDAGIELTFLDYALLLCIYPNKLNVYCGGDGQNSINTDVPTPPNNVDTLWRILFYPNHTMEVYRAGILVYGPVLMPISTMAYQRVLWWAESGALAVFKAFRYYLGGAVIPG